MTEIHQFLPLKLPLAPLDVTHSNRNARRNERKKAKKGKVTTAADAGEDAGDACSDLWSIACGGSDFDHLLSPALSHKTMSRQCSGGSDGVPAFELPPAAERSPVAACSGESPPAPS